MSYAVSPPAIHRGVSRFEQRHDTRSLVSYDQVLKKGRLAQTYLYHPSVSITRTITTQYFEDLLQIVQMRLHLWIKPACFRWPLGLLFKVLLWCGIIVLLPSSIIEITWTVLFSYISSSSAKQIGLMGQVMLKYKGRDYGAETLTIYAQDDEMASAIRSARPVMHDALGWTYEFPSDVPPDRIAAIGRCWRMANDFRMRITSFQHSIECVPGRGARPLTVSDMYMNGRYEITRRRVFKVVKPCVKLLDVLNEGVETKSSGGGFRFKAIIEGDLFRQFSLLALRDRLIRDNEARGFGANPNAMNPMIRFMKIYIRSWAQAAGLVGGHLLFSDSPLLERTAFALTFGLIISEMWVTSSAHGIELPVGTKHGSPWQTDHEAWIRFRERQAPFSSDMSPQNSCFLRHRPDGVLDIPPVRMDELAIVHGVLVTRKGRAFLRDGYDLYTANVRRLMLSRTLCIEDWKLVGNEDAIEDVETGNLDTAHERASAEDLHLLFHSDMVVGCQESFGQQE